MVLLQLDDEGLQPGLECFFLGGRTVQQILVATAQAVAKDGGRVIGQ